jgi:hypothetical protein
MQAVFPAMVHATSAAVLGEGAHFLGYRFLFLLCRGYDQIGFPRPFHFFSRQYILTPVERKVRERL